MGQVNTKKYSIKGNQPKFTEIGGPSNDPNDPENLKDPFFFLAPEIVMKILSHFDRKQLAYISSVSKRWRACAYDPYLWDTFEVLISKPWTIDDTKILGLIFAQSSRSAWNFNACEKITNVAIKYLIYYCNKITSIDLYGCKKMDDGALEMLAKSRHAETLKSLYLSWVGKITSKGMLFIANECTNLSKLSLFGTNIEHVEVFLPKMTQLEYLDIGGIRNIENNLKQVTIYCTNLKSLKMREAPATSILTSVTSLNTKLTELDISGISGINPPMLKSLVQICPNIQSLNIAREDTRFPGQNIRIIVDAWKENLRILNLHGIHIQKESAEYIINNCLQLEELIIEFITYNSLNVLSVHHGKFKKIEVEQLYGHPTQEQINKVLQVKE